MKNITLLLGLLLSLSILSSCNVEPEPIHYGSDQCHFCKMNIVDKQHAAQYVTKKGKQFKFDAIECMINQLATLDENDMAILLVSDFSSPGEMTDATQATYLISPTLKSPMGAFLTGFSTKEKATLAQKEYKGKLYNWNEVKKQIQNN